MPLRESRYDCKVPAGQALWRSAPARRMPSSDVGATADDRHATCFSYFPRSAIIEQFDGVTGVSKLRRVVAGMVDADAKLVDARPT